jgi:hypothetical protein
MILRFRSSARTTLILTGILLLVVVGFFRHAFRLDVHSFVYIDAKIDDRTPSQNSSMEEEEEQEEEVVGFRDYIGADVAGIDIGCKEEIGGNASAAAKKEEELPRNHPHAGARHCNGSWGYVADVTAPRKWIRTQWFAFQTASNNSTTTNTTNTTNTNTNAKNSTNNFSSFLPMTAEEFESVCETPPGEGFEGKGGWEFLTKKIRVNGPDPYFLLANQSKSWARPNPPNEKVGGPPRILCIVYTYPKKHRLVRAAFETWGHRCDGFLAASTKTIPEYGIVDLPHKGPEEYNNMWQKVRSMWAYVHDHYIDDFDYFHMGGDDTHTIVENLRNFLWSVGGGKDTGGGPNPLYFGTPTKRENFYVNGGGAGYTINRVTLRALVQKALPKCMAGAHVSAEDRFVGKCLHNLGIVGNPTWDAFGQNRYHGMDPQWLYNYDGTKKKNRHWKVKYAFHEKLIGKPMGLGLDRASSQSVSFHLFKTPVKLKRHHAILYRSCPIGTILGDALDSIGDWTHTSPSSASGEN